MNDEQKIETMNDASEAVAKREPLRITLESGKTVDIKPLSWMCFQELWDELSGLVSLILTGDDGTTELVEKTREKVTERLRTAPALIAKLIEMGSDTTVENIGTDFQDVFAVADGVVTFNFILRADIWRFFNSALSASGQGRSQPSETETS